MIFTYYPYDFCHRSFWSIHRIVGYCYKYTRATYEWFCGSGSQLVWILMWQLVVPPRNYKNKAYFQTSFANLHSSRHYNYSYPYNILLLYLGLVTKDNVTKVLLRKNLGNFAISIENQISRALVLLLCLSLHILTRLQNLAFNSVSESEFLLFSLLPCPKLSLLVELERDWQIRAYRSKCFDGPWEAFCTLLGEINPWMYYL